MNIYSLFLRCVILKIERAKISITKAMRAIWGTFPVILGTVLLISLATAFIPRSAYASIFSGGSFLDAILGAGLGSILAGNPSTSYIIGGELLDFGISALAVTAFLVSWVTVGIIQFPAESILLGKSFALSRNISAFVFSLIVAFVVVSVVGAW